KPRTLADAAKRLAEQTGCNEARCRAQLQAFLMLASRPAHERSGTGDRACLAFKLDRFIAGAGRLFAAPRGPGRGPATLDGQRFHPDDQKARLYAPFSAATAGRSTTRWCWRKRKALTACCRATSTTPRLKIPAAPSSRAT